MLLATGAATARSVMRKETASGMFTWRHNACGSSGIINDSRKHCQDILHVNYLHICISLYVAGRTADDTRILREIVRSDHIPQAAAPASLANVVVD